MIVGRIAANGVDCDATLVGRIATNGVDCDATLAVSNVLTFTIL